MLKRFVSSTLLVMAGMTTAAVAQEDYSTWLRYREITVNTTAAGANVTGTVNAFPLLVRLDSTHADVFNTVNARASLRFTNAAGTTRYPHSVDTWDSAGKTAAVWVRLDVPGNATTTLRMYWNRTGVVDSSSAGSVFNTNNGFLSVFPMGGDRTTDRPNAVPNRPAATPKNLPESYTARKGVIGLADTLGTSGGTALTAEHFSFGPITATDMPTSNLTMSMWIKPANPLQPYAHAMTIAGTGNDKQNNLYIAKIDWRGATKISFYAVANGNGDELGVTGGTGGDWTPNNWQLVHAVLDGGVRRLYANGVQVGASANLAQPAIMDRANALIGATLWPDPAFHGVYDEVRVANVSRSADWAKLEYETQKPTGVTAVAIGSTVTQTPGVAPITNLHFGNDTLNALLNTPFTITATYNGGPIDSFKVISGTLPTGLTLNKTTGVISGTATAAAAAANIVVRGWAGTEDSAQITLRVAAVQGLSNLRYVSTNAGTRDTLRLELTVAANVTPTITGTPTRYSINGSIPAGLSFDSTTGRIHGTPTALQSGLNRTVTATGPFNTTTRDIRIIVTLGPPTATYHPRDTLTATVGASLTAAPITGGRALTKWTAVTALPAGLRLDTLNGAISGVPTAAAAAANYTIRGTSATDTLNKVIRLTVSAATADGDYKTAWSGHRRIKLNTSASGANVAGTVTNVPVLVRFDSTQADVFTNGGTNGASLRFTKTDATTRLPHEIDTWDAAARKGAVWVLVDTVKGNTAAQEIWLHYGNASASPVSNAHAVFSEANGFVSVFHLGGGNNVSPRHNAVSGRNPAYPFNLPATHASHAGIIGTADSLGGNGAGAASQHFSFGPIPAGTFTNTQGTLSLWLKPSTPFNAYASHAISLGSGTPNNNFWVGRFGGETVASIAGSSGDATSEGDRFVGPNDAASGWAQGEWQLVHFSLDNTEVNVYKNGGLIGSASNQKLPDGVRSSAYIGRALWSADALLAGLYDEVRVANKARSDSWVKLEYENQRAAQTLVSIDTLTFPGTGIAQASLLQDQLSFSPTNGGVMFNIRTDKAANARLEVIDMRGRAVWSRSLKTTSGLNQVLWSGRSEQGAGTGVYFVRMLLLDENNVPTHRLERKLPLTR